MNGRITKSVAGISALSVTLGLGAAATVAVKPAPARAESLCLRSVTASTSSAPAEIHSAQFSDLMTPAFCA
jgi:hypothetical protein